MNRGRELKARISNWTDLSSRNIRRKRREKTLMFSWRISFVFLSMGEERGGRVLSFPGAGCWYVNLSLSCDFWNGQNGSQGFSPRSTSAGGHRISLKKVHEREREFLHTARRTSLPRCQFLRSDSRDFFESFLKNSFRSKKKKSLKIASSSRRH